MPYVIKADGRKEPFNAGKIIKTCLAAGATRQRAEQIVRAIKSKIGNGTTTHNIYRMLIEELEKLNDKSSMVFRMREAIADMDSTSFELFTKRLLKGLGYRSRWNQLIKGRYVEHQVDVVAKKDGKVYMIECKKHFNQHRFCSLGITLQVNARFEDLKLGFLDGKHGYDFYKPWIFNNTKFSDHAIQYGEGVGMLLTGWGYKGDLALDAMVNRMKMYPVTILKCDIGLQKKLLSRRIITIFDLIDSQRSELSQWMDKNVMQKILQQAEELAEG